MNRHILLFVLISAAAAIATQAPNEQMCESCSTVDKFQKTGRVLARTCFYGMEMAADIIESLVPFGMLQIIEIPLGATLNVTEELLTMTLMASNQEDHSVLKTTLRIVSHLDEQANLFQELLWHQATKLFKGVTRSIVFLLIFIIFGIVAYGFVSVCMQTKSSTIVG